MLGIRTKRCFVWCWKTQEAMYAAGPGAAFQGSGGIFLRLCPLHVLSTLCILIFWFSSFLSLVVSVAYLRIVNFNKRWMRRNCVWLSWRRLLLRLSCFLVFMVLRVLICRLLARLSLVSEHSFLAVAWMMWRFKSVNQITRLERVKFRNAESSYEHHSDRNLHITRTFALLMGLFRYCYNFSGANLNSIDPESVRPYKITNLSRRL